MEIMFDDIRIISMQTSFDFLCKGLTFSLKYGKVKMINFMCNGGKTIEIQDKTAGKSNYSAREH